MNTSFDSESSVISASGDELVCFEEEDQLIDRGWFVLRQPAVVFFLRLNVWKWNLNCVISCAQKCFEHFSILIIYLYIDHFHSVLIFKSILIQTQHFLLHWSFQLLQSKGFTFVLLWCHNQQDDIISFTTRSTKSVKSLGRPEQLTWWPGGVKILLTALRGQRPSKVLTPPSFHLTVFRLTVQKIKR